MFVQNQINRISACAMHAAAAPSARERMQMKTTRESTIDTCWGTDDDSRVGPSEIVTGRPSFVAALSIG
jgi:hypothetical protein